LALLFKLLETEAFLAIDGVGYIGEKLAAEFGEIALSARNASAVKHISHCQTYHF